MLASSIHCVQNGETFAITLHGEAAAKLVPARTASREAIQKAIADLKASRTILNPRGKRKLRIRDLIAEGRA